MGPTTPAPWALLLADIEDMRAVFGPEVRITIPTINPANLRRYVQEGPDLRIAPMPTVFFAVLGGSSERATSSSSWSKAARTWTCGCRPWLRAYLWATHWADEFDKPCAAYAVDAGQIKSGLNRRLVRSQASETDLIITLVAAVAERLRSWGVTAPIEVTADNAFTFVPDPADAGLFDLCWLEAGDRVMGLAWSTSTSSRS